MEDVVVIVKHVKIEAEAVVKVVWRWEIDQIFMLNFMISQ